LEKPVFGGRDPRLPIHWAMKVDHLKLRPRVNKTVSVFVSVTQRPTERVCGLCRFLESYRNLPNLAESSRSYGAQILIPFRHLPHRFVKFQAIKAGTDLL